MIHSAPIRRDVLWPIVERLSPEPQAQADVCENPLPTPGLSGAHAPALVPPRERWRAAVRGLRILGQLQGAPIKLQAEYYHELSAAGRTQVSVLFCSDAELLALRTQWVNGCLHHAATRQPVCGTQLFVIDAHGHLLVARERPDGTLKHSSLSRGLPVRAAGELQCDARGSLLAISNKSGHYVPGAANLRTVTAALHEAGADLDRVQCIDFVALKAQVRSLLPWVAPSEHATFLNDAKSIASLLCAVNVQTLMRAIMQAPPQERGEMVARAARLARVSPLLREEHVPNFLPLLLGLGKDSAPAPAPTLAQQIRQHRLPRTAVCRSVERAVAEVGMAHPLTRAMGAVFVQRIQSLRDALPPALAGNLALDAHLLLPSTNSRQLFTALTEHRGSLWALLHHLARLDARGTPLAQQLAAAGLLNLPLLRRLYVTSVGRPVKHMFSAPPERRAYWKAAVPKRRLPLPVRHLRLAEVPSPPLAEVELQNAQAGRVPWKSVADAARIVDPHPFTQEATAAGMHLLSGTSGTLYRLMNAWLIMAGDAQGLFALRFAATAHMLAQRHHTLHEVLLASQDFLHDYMPGLHNALHCLVPRALQVEYQGQTHTLTPEAFRASVDAVAGASEGFDGARWSITADAAQWQQDLNPTI